MATLTRWLTEPVPRGRIAAFRTLVYLFVAADIVWFDALVTNIDRTPRNPNLLVWHGRPWLIDHGASLYVQHTWREPEASAQPVLLTIESDNPNGAAVRFLLDGAPPPADASAYRRIVLLFDGGDADAVAAARTHWSEGRAKGLDVTWWQADAQGRWTQRVADDCEK